MTQRPGQSVFVILAGISMFIMGTLASIRGEDPCVPLPRSTSTVGMPARLEQVVLPGSELEVKPLDDRRAPFVLRITSAYPHGSAFRYDFACYGLEPGDYDLRNYLKRKDGSAVADLPPMPVRVDPVLPPGQVEPHSLSLEASPWLGGYRLLLATVGSFWCAGLAAILLLGRRKRAADEAEDSRPVTMADRLRPLVASAIAGTLSPGQHAELERLLIGYWRKRLGLDQASPAETIAIMRAHPEAGPLLHALEEWLHNPGARAEAVDLPALLRPYLDLRESDQEDEPLAQSPALAAREARP